MQRNRLIGDKEVASNGSKREIKTQVFFMLLQEEGGREINFQLLKMKQAKRSMKKNRLYKCLVSSTQACSPRETLILRF